MDYPEQKEKFVDRMYSEWLPAFCDSRAGDFKVEGFHEKSLKRLTGYDACWFMEAVDKGFVVENGGFFTAPKSSAKEQVFWGGRKGMEIRDIYLWAEPVITIGAVARLVEEFNWPIDLVGTQSKYPWPFDLVCYASNADDYIIACEVKKSKQEIVKLIDQMVSFSTVEPLQTEPENATARNAYRKIVGIRESWPEIFWALGPDGFEMVFRIQRVNGTDVFTLLELSDNTHLDRSLRKD
ncbi:MAG: hypothetical protein ACI861_001256 [Paracoccaceae bacterium]|jgi:hypothetical protein